MRYFFEIAYKGTHYHGWQMQDNALTIQQVVSESLSTMLREDIEVTGSGRTDTGVHCRQQYFHIDVGVDLNVEEIKYKLNSFLPYDISIQSVARVKEDAHARFDAISRSYQYHITVVKDPFLKEFAYYYNKPLDIQTMNRAATLLLGKQDFECFSKVKTEVNNFICDITRAEWVMSGNQLIFNISANRFLRGMVRAITGTLLNVGLGKCSQAELEDILKSKDRKKAGRAVPAHGLFLTAVNYPKEIFIS